MAAVPSLLEHVPAPSAECTCQPYCAQSYCAAIDAVHVGASAAVSMGGAGVPLTTQQLAAHTVLGPSPDKARVQQAVFPLQESQTNLLSKDLFCLWSLHHDQVTGTLRPGGSLGLCLPQLVPPLCQVSSSGRSNFYVRMTKTVKAISWLKP